VQVQFVSAGNLVSLHALHSVAWAR